MPKRPYENDSLCEINSNCSNSDRETNLNKINIRKGVSESHVIQIAVNLHYREERTLLTSNIITLCLVWIEVKSEVILPYVAINGQGVISH